MYDNTNRKYVIQGIFIFLTVIFIVRLFFLQVVNSSYKISAENNSTRHVTRYPARGLIYDRNDQLLVYNEAAYDLMVIPKQVEPFDTSDFCQVLNIKREFVRKMLKKVKRYSKYKPSVFLKQISAKKYAILQEKLYKFQGFFVQTRTLRKYPQNIAAHVLGYVGEINSKHLKNDSYYAQGDYIGISGIEKSYETELRGKKGKSIYLVDVFNRIKGSFKNGEFDEKPVVGRNLTSTLDADLQAYGEQLMQNKKGSVVIIEPATGEILALISSPNYDPNRLVGRVRSKNYKQLANNPQNPLFNRALMAKYPPGSTFKLINALVALQEGVITEKTHFSCHGGYRVGSFHLHCHHNASFALVQSIQLSCNAYYCNVFRRILDNKKYENIDFAYNSWYRYLNQFGLGRKLGSDLSLELRGNVPKSSYFDKLYGKGRWKSLMLVSMSIGQGELGITPLQMANMTAAIANRGYFYVPHIVKKIAGKDTINQLFTRKQNIKIDSAYFNRVIDGMEMVVVAGTATTARIKGISVCGKTGTAENPHGKDHSIFTSFAPKEKPKIVVSVYVENAGFGSTWAAPIASLLIEKYLNDSISRPYLEKRIIEGYLLEK